MHQNTKKPGRKSRFLVLSSLLLGVHAAFGIPSQAVAEEPAAKFLQRLKEEGYYDQALKYLDLSVQKNRLPASMKEDIGLEKVMLLQMSLAEVRTAKDLDVKLAQVEQGYKEFLTNSPQHPRRGETLLKLADLYLDRGTKLLEDSKEDARKPELADKAKEQRERARGSLQQAFETYTTTIDSLRPTLEQMQGANVKPNETERLALREKLQREYRQAQILQAISNKLTAETFDANSPEWKQRLEDAEKKLADVADKSSKQAGAKYLSLLNRGRIQAMLGQVDGARETLKRVAENEDAGIFRTWRIQAVSDIVRLDSTAASGKYEAAIMAGEEQLKMVDFREREKPEWQDLQLAVAEARLAWIKTLDPKGDEAKIRNLKREARDAFQNLAKKQGRAGNIAKDYLKDLGIEVKGNTDDNKLPDANNFTEAMKAGRSRWIVLKREMLPSSYWKSSLKMLRKRIAKGSRIRSSLWSPTWSAIVCKLSSFMTKR